MVKVPDFLKNPVFASALICSILIYSKVVTVKDRNPFTSPVKNENIESIWGRVTSNPVKCDLFSGTYRMFFDVKKISSSYGLTSTASGEITIFISDKTVEALYPGRLYTAAEKKGAALIENGVYLKLSVSEIKKSGYKNSFLCTEVQNLKTEKTSFFDHFYKFRALCRLNFKRLMFSWNEGGGLLLALISGSREYTEKETGLAFRNSGLSHILALSGMHLSLFGGIALLFGKKISSKRLADFLQLLAISFFVWFAGISPSLFRAFLCSLIIFICSLLKTNKPDGLSTLSFSFCIHTVVFPEHLWDAGFMLSYSSLLGIILFSKLFKKLYPAMIPFKLRSSLADSTAAQLSTSPVALKLFGKLMPVGIIASIIVSPLVIIFLYTGLSGMILCLLFPFLNSYINAIINGLYKIIKSMVLFFSRFS